MTETPHPFRRDGLGYIYEPATPEGVTLGVRLKADYLSRRAGDVTAEIVVESLLPGMAGHLHQGRLNLDSTNGKRDLAKVLSDRTSGAVSWRDLLEEFCVGILRAERAGEPFQTVGPSQERGQGTYQIERLLPANRPTLLYGPWSAGKGWLATFVTVCVAAGLGLAGLGVHQGPTLYLDWEDDKETFDERVWMVARGLGLEAPPPNIYYRRCRGALSGQVHQIARFVDERQIVTTVIDSVGLAAGQMGERGSYEDNALALFDGLRSIHGTHLLIDHVSEEGRQNGKTIGKAYGSIYKMALVRNAWEIRKDQEQDAHSFSVGLYHTKANHGPILPALGFRLDFSIPSICAIERQDLDTSSELASRLAVHIRMAALIEEAGEPMWIKDVADALGITQTHARKEANVHRDKFSKATDGRWMLRGAKNGAIHMEDLENGDRIPF